MTDPRGIAAARYKNANDTQAGAPPSGAASGVLTGNYPAPGLATTGAAAGTYTFPTVTVAVDGRITAITGGNLDLFASRAEGAVTATSAVAQNTPVPWNSVSFNSIISLNGAQTIWTLQPGRFLVLVRASSSAAAAAWSVLVGNVGTPGLDRRYSASTSAAEETTTFSFFVESPTVSTVQLQPTAAGNTTVGLAANGGWLTTINFQQVYSF